MAKEYPLYDQKVIFRELRTMVEKVAEKYGDDPAFSYKENPTDEKKVTVSYEQVRRDVRALGTALVEQGCRGEKCAIIASNSMGWAYAYFALMAIGAVTVPLDHDWLVDDLSGAVEKAKCRYIFYSGDDADKIEEVRSRCPGVKACFCIWGTPIQGDLCRVWLQSQGQKLLEAGDTTYDDYTLDPDALASIVFTSGTTGKGKGVMLSQSNICYPMVEGQQLFQITRDCVCILPLHHTFGSTCNLVGHYGQGSHIYFSSGLRYFTKELTEQKPTHVMLVPLFLEKIYKKIWSTARKNGQEKLLRRMMGLSNVLRKIGIDARRKMFASILNLLGGNLELIVSGGAPLSPEVAGTFEAVGITIINGYGITECAPLISVNRNKLRKQGSVGRPVPGLDVKIANPDELGDGEICVKGPNVMLGYYEDPDATAAVFDEEGYFRTGDLGHLDEDGWIYITGRLKNLIILANGKNVYPEEIEYEIGRFDGTGEVVVYAGESRADASREVIVAEIYPDPDFFASYDRESPKEYFGRLVSELNSRMPSYKAVGLVKIRNTEFEKNTSKKILRFAIDRTVD